MFFKLRMKKKSNLEKANKTDLDILNKSTYIQSTKETDISISMIPSRTYCDSFTANRNVPEIYERKTKKISKFSISNFSKTQNPNTKNDETNIEDGFWPNSRRNSSYRRRKSSDLDVNNRSIKRVKSPYLQREVNINRVKTPTPLKSVQKEKGNYTISVITSSFNGDSKLVTQASLQ